MSAAIISALNKNTRISIFLWNINKMDMFQVNLINYLIVKKDVLLVSLNPKNNENIIIIDNFAEKTLEFLKNEIIKDIQKYKENKNTYNFLMNILIEANISHKDSEFLKEVELISMYLFLG